MKKLLLLVALVSAPSYAQWSSASVVTDDGIEIGIEPRVFSAFALLNEAGYDKETIFGPAPLELPKYSAYRQKLRQLSSRSSNAGIVALIGKHPGTTQQYIDAVLQLGPPPRFDDKGASSTIAKGLAPALREWFNEEGGSSYLRTAQGELRDLQKKLLPTVDGAGKAVTKIVRLGDVSDQLLDDAGAQGRVAFIINELDAHGSLSVHKAGDTVGVFAGPFRDKADEDRAVDAVTIAFADTQLSREVNKVDAKGTLLEAHKNVSDATKKAYPSPKDWGRGLLACAVAREALQRKAVCTNLDGDDRSETALAVLAPRIKEFAPTSALFSAALPELLAAAPNSSGEVTTGTPTILGSLDPEIIRRIVRENGAQISSCYETELKQTPGLSGKIVMKFVINGEGKVAQATKSESQMNNAGVENCLASRILTWEFPKPKGGGIVIVNYPFVFKQR